MRLEIDGEVGTLTLDRPGELNAMSPTMIAELATVSAWLADRAPIRALVVTGSGRAFSAGGDVTWFRRGLDDPDADLVASVRHGADVLHQAIVDFKRIPYPVIAAVNGPAAGAGFSLALMCDLRIASDGAFFACAYGRIGASPDGGMTYFLPRVIGPAAAAELMLEDPNLTAADALERGLVSRVVAADELVGAAVEVGTRIAGWSRPGVELTKRSLWSGLDAGSLAQHMNAEGLGQLYVRLLTDNFDEAVAARHEGRDPVFRD